MKLITLKKGPVEFTAQYHDAGEPQRELVVCLHGFPDNANTYRYQVPAFLDAGYRVLVPTMRGYETSSATNHNDYSIATLARDVIGWLDHLSVKKVHLVGHDWGSPMAYSAAAMAPDRFHSITTIAIPHPRRFSREGLWKVPQQALMSWYMLFNQIPKLSDYVSLRNDCQFLKFLWRKWSPHYMPNDEQWRDLCETFNQPGVIKATLSYYRQNVSLGQLFKLSKSAIDGLHEIPVPNLAIVGTDDGCAHERVFDVAVLAEDHPKGFELVKIAGAGHFVHQERPSEINPLLLSWFKTNQIGENNE